MGAPGWSQRGLQSDTMALITSDRDAMRRLRSRRTEPPFPGFVRVSTRISTAAVLTAAHVEPKR